MSYQVQQPTSASAESLKTLKNEAIRVEISEDLKRSMPIGAKLSLQVKTDSSGNQGAIINGRFYPAEIPVSITSGQTVEVQVLDNTSSLLLRLLRQEPNQVPTGAGQLFIEMGTKGGATLPFQKFLELLFPKLPYESFAPATNRGSSQIPESFLANLNLKEIANPGTFSPIESAIKSLRNLLKEGAIITSEKLSEPDQLTQAINKLINNDVTRGLKEAQSALQEITKLNSGTSTQRLLVALRDQIDLVLKEPLDLSFTASSELKPGRSRDSNLELQTPVEQPTNLDQLDLQQQLRLYLEASILLMESGNRQALAQITSAIRDLKATSNPLLILFQTLSWLKPDLDSKLREGPHSMHSTLKQVIDLLRQLREQNADNQEIRTGLQKSAQLIDNELKQSSLSNNDLKELPQTMQLLKGMESMLSSRESLSQLNSLMQNLGQPLIFFLPLLYNDQIINWQLTWHPYLPEPDNKKQPKKDSEKQRLQMFIPFSRFGAVEVDLSFSQTELHMRLTFEKNVYAEFVKSRSDQLRERLEAIGFKRCVIQAMAGEPQEVIPTWYNEISRRWIVA